MASGATKVVFRGRMEGQQSGKARAMSLEGADLTACQNVFDVAAVRAKLSLIANDIDEVNNPDIDVIKKSGF